MNDKSTAAGIYARHRQDVHRYLLRMTAGSAAQGLDLEVGRQETGFLFSSRDCWRTAASSHESPETPALAAAPPDLAAALTAHPLAIKWALAARLVSSGADRAVFDLEWQRTNLDGGVAPLGDRRTIALRYGDRHVLDFHPCPADSRYANAIVEVTAAPVVVAGAATYSSEIWLVHQAADGRKTTRKALVSGRQGERASFRFEPVPLPIEAGASESRLNLDVSGTTMLREGQDGTIELALETTRAVRDPVGGGSESGTKLLTVKEGETIEVILPNRGGTGQWRLRDNEPGPKNLLPGVSVADGVVKIDAPRFFEGCTTSVLVTVRRAK